MTTDRTRPDLDDTTVEALGKLSEALETVDQARGFLYAFHQLTGKADRQLQESVTLFEKAGYADLAGTVRTEIVGRNVLYGRWTFQIVEDFDEGYWQPFRDVERDVRNTLMGGKRHVFEAELKEQRRTRGMPGHESRPDGE